MDNGGDMFTQLDIIVRKEGHTFFVYDRSWHHLVEDEDLNRAYEQIIDKRRLLRERCQLAGLEQELPEAQGRQGAGSPRLVDTLTKSVLVGVVLSAFVFLGSLTLIEYLQEATSPSPHLVGKIATGMIVKTARTLEELSPENKDKIRQSLRTIAREVEPLRSSFQTSGVGDVRGSAKRQS